MRGTPSARHGRYSHTRQYLERVLADANLRPEIVPAELRLEAGDPVPGLVVRATKPMLSQATPTARSSGLQPVQRGCLPGWRRQQPFLVASSRSYALPFGIQTRIAPAPRLAHVKYGTATSGASDVATVAGTSRASRYSAPAQPSRLLTTPAAPTPGTPASAAIGPASVGAPPCRARLGELDALGQVRLLEAVDDRSALDRDAPAHGVDPWIRRVSRGETSSCRLDAIACAPRPAYLGISPGRPRRRRRSPFATTPGMRSASVHGSSSLSTISIPTSPCHGYAVSIRSHRPAPGRQPSGAYWWSCTPSALRSRGGARRRRASA